MKTLSQVYREIVASEELKNRFVGLKNADQVVDFIRSLDAEATLEEIAIFLKEKQVKKGELSEADLLQISGGKSTDDLPISLLALGLDCAVTLVVSATQDSDNGKKNDGVLYCEF